MLYQWVVVVVVVADVAVRVQVFGCWLLACTWLPNPKGGMGTMPVEQVRCLYLASQLIKASMSQASAQGESTILIKQAVWLLCTPCP